eukprot:COSAG04_NODE_31254_length_257_cov_1.810127_1_plen_74_part_01
MSLNFPSRIRLQKGGCGPTVFRLSVDASELIWSSMSLVSHSVSASDCSLMPHSLPRSSARATVGASRFATEAPH